MIRATVVITAILALHIGVGLQHGLPSLNEGDSGSASFLLELWAIEAALLGAGLVALFFLFQAVQAMRPPAAVLAELTARLRVWLWLGLLAGATLGSGVSYVLKTGTTLWEPADFPGVQSLPLLDFLLLGLSLLGILWIAMHAVRYLHPDTLDRLAQEIVTRRAHSLRKHEIAEHRWRSRSSPSIKIRRAGEPEPDRRFKFPSPYAMLANLENRAARRHKAVLASLLSETKTKALAGFADDDVSTLDAVLHLHRLSVEAASRASEPTQKQHVLEQTATPALSTFENWSVFITELDYLELLSEALRFEAINCHKSLLWAAVRTWRSGITLRDASLTHFGLNLLAHSYAMVADTDKKSLLPILRDYWRDQPNGPEHFVMHDARSVVRRTGVSDQDQVFFVLASVEIQEQLLLIAATALAKEDFDTSGDLIASLATVQNVFHYVVSDADSPSELRAAVDKYDLVRMQGLALLIGLAAVRFTNGDDSVQNVMSYAVSTLCEDWSDDFVSRNLRLSEYDEPRWFWDLRSIAEAPRFNSREHPHDYAYMEDLQGFALVLSKSWRSTTDSFSTAKKPISSNWKANELERRALDRIKTEPARWKDLLAPTILKRAIPRTRTRRTQRPSKPPEAITSASASPPGNDTTGSNM